MSAKEKIVRGRGPSNINLDIFVCSFDDCRASLTIILLPNFMMWNLTLFVILNELPVIGYP